MGQKQLSPAMIASRIASHGTVNGHTDDEGIFSLGGLPFSIYLRPKTSVADIDVVMEAKLFQEDDQDRSNAPFPVYDWTPMAITELKVPASVSSAFDIYWGSGDYVEKED